MYQNQILNNANTARYTISLAYLLKDYSSHIKCGIVDIYHKILI